MYPFVLRPQIQHLCLVKVYKSLSLDSIYMFIPECLLSGSIPIKMICNGNFREYSAPFMYHDSRSASAVVQLFNECPQMTMPTLCRLVQENFDPSYPSRRTLIDSSRWKVYIQTTTIGQNGRQSLTFKLLDPACPVLHIPVYLLDNHCISFLAESDNHVLNHIGTIEPGIMSIDSMMASATTTSISKVPLLCSDLAKLTAYVRNLESQSLAGNIQKLAQYQRHVKETTALYEHALEQARLQQQRNQ